MRRSWRVLAALLMSVILLAALLSAHAEEPDEAEIPTADSGNSETVQTGEKDSDESTNAGLFSMPEAITPSSLGVSQVDQDENTIYDEAGLAEWCKANAHTGGTVRLGGMVTISEGIYQYFDWPVTIDTGPYGLIYDGGSLTLTPFEITGEGVDVPVLDVVDPNTFRMSWIHVIQPLHITATGRDGEGGTALRISQADDTWLPNFSYFLQEGLIRSEGSGAVGVHIAVPADVYCLNVEVVGDGAVAICADQGANLYYCKLKADSGTAASGIDILLDTCAVTGADGDAWVVNRHITGISGGRLYLPVKQGDELDIWQLPSFLNFILSGDEQYPSRNQALVLVWPANPIDTAALGRQTMLGQLLAPFCGLGLDNEFPLVLIVDVRDPVIPCISAITFNENPDSGNFVVLQFWEPNLVEREKLILWRSDDDGKTWTDYTNADTIIWTDYTNAGTWEQDQSVCFYYDTIDASIQFQLEIPGRGESNIVILNTKDGQTLGGNGGDRVGGDRVISTKPDNAPPENPSINQRNNNPPSNNPPQKGDSLSGDNDTVDENPLNDNPPINVVPIIGEPREPDSGNTPQPPIEWENDSGIGISGRRLAALLSIYPEAVPFIKQGVELAVSSVALRELRVADHQLFSVEVIKERDYLTVSFRVDGKLIESLPATATIEGFTISLTGSGTYAIKADDEKPTESKPAAPEPVVPTAPAKPVGNEPIPMGNPAQPAGFEQTQTSAEREPMPVVTEMEKTASASEPAMQPAAGAVPKANPATRDVSAENRTPMALLACFAVALFIVGAVFRKRLMKW